MIMSIIKGNINMMVKNVNKCLEKKQIVHFEKLIQMIFPLG
jgi:hypothetical protein